MGLGTRRGWEGQMSCSGPRSLSKEAPQRVSEPPVSMKRLSVQDEEARALTPRHLPATRSRPPRPCATEWEKALRGRRPSAGDPGPPAPAPPGRRRRRVWRSGRRSGRPAGPPASCRAASIPPTRAIARSTMTTSGCVRCAASTTSSPSVHSATASCRPEVGVRPGTPHVRVCRRPTAAGSSSLLTWSKGVPAGVGPCPRALVDAAPFQGAREPASEPEGDSPATRGWRTPWTAGCRAPPSSGAPGGFPRGSGPRRRGPAAPPPGLGVRPPRRDGPVARSQLDRDQRLRDSPVEGPRW